MKDNHQEYGKCSEILQNKAKVNLTSPWYLLLSFRAPGKDTLAKIYRKIKLDISGEHGYYKTKQKQNKKPEWTYEYPLNK